MNIYIYIERGRSIKNCMYGCNRLSLIFRIWTKAYMDASKRAVRYCKLLKVNMIPKFHLLMHLAHRINITGNPSHHTTYQDEHVNGVLATLCTNAHASKFTYRVLKDFRASVTKRGEAPFKKRLRTVR